MGSLRITQVRSVIGHPRPQRATLRALGLRRIGQQVERPDSASVRGMARAIRHLVKVEEVSDADGNGAAE